MPADTARTLRPLRRCHPHKGPAPAAATLLAIAALLACGCSVRGFSTPYNKGVDAFRDGKLPEAAEHFRAAIDGNEQFVEAWYNLARTYDELAQSYRDRADDVSATAGPADTPAAMRAELRRRARDAMEKAERAYQRTIELKPDAARALASYAMFRYEQGDREAAGELLARANDAETDRAWPLAALGHYHELEGRHEAAREAYQQALLREPADSLALYRLGSWHFHRQQPGDARKHLEKAVQSDPGDAAAWRRLGEVYAEVDEPVMAASALERFVEIAGADGRTLATTIVDVLLQMAMHYQTAGRHEWAVHALWEARTMRESDPRVARLLLDSYEALRRDELARLLENGTQPPADPPALSTGGTAGDPDDGDDNAPGEGE